MHKSKLITFSLSLTTLALTLGAAEVWTKDSKDWTDADVQRILTSSPWAQKTAASMTSQRGSGGSFPSDSTGGSGYPGGGSNGGSTGGMGGMGMPGGGVGRGGGMGGGGMGGGGGTGYPGGGRSGRNGGDTSSRNRMEVVVRWDSSAPVKQALIKSNSALADTAGKAEKSYIISVAGLHMPGSSDSDHLRNVLMESTQLQVKGKDSINPDDLKMESESDGTETAQFFFPRSSPIDLDDKEVTFMTQTGGLKIEHKFKLKDMVYNGKLSL